MKNKKIMMIKTAGVLATASARAADINPYIAGKV
jgi:hypothetical protein